MVNTKRRKKKLINEIRKKGLVAERKAKKWLENKGFKIIYPMKVKPSNLPYDIKAKKGRDIWVIDVKSGCNPSISLSNFKKLLEERNTQKIGYIFVIGKRLYLLSYDKRSQYADKAWARYRSKIIKGMRKH